MADNIPPACLSTPNPALDDFLERFRQDVVRLVETCNIHKHSATCYKYWKALSDSSKICRMRMPRALVDTSSIDSCTGQIFMRRSHPWINNFNEWLISACRSNMDIKFIWCGTDAKALVYYITDYVTKSSLAFHDMFALAQQGIKSNEQHRSLNVVEDAVEKSRKLVLRCYNMIASHQEIAGVQVASYLMNYGDHYTTHTFRNLFLISVEKYLQAQLIEAQKSEIVSVEGESSGKDCALMRASLKLIFVDSFNLCDDEQEEDVKETEEQFVLEPAENGNRYVMVNTRLDYQHRSAHLAETCLYDFVSHFHKKVIDKTDRRVLKEANAQQGERLSTNGTKMNERHTFQSAHPQSSSHLLIKRTTPVVPVLLGPQIPRREREETRERYCRALLTLFVPWRTVYDLCTSNQTWSTALHARMCLISDSSRKIIDNIQLLHECKSDRDEHLLRVITESDDNKRIDPILISSSCEENGDDQEDDPEELLQMLSYVNESTTEASSIPLSTQEQRYLHDALQTIDKTDRFSLLNSKFKYILHTKMIRLYSGYKNGRNRNDNHSVDDTDTFAPAHADDNRMIKRWKHEIENRKDQLRNYLITGEDTVATRNDEKPLEVMTVDVSTISSNNDAIAVPSVTKTVLISPQIKSDIMKNFTLNDQQRFAFSIITDHLDQDKPVHAGTLRHSLEMYYRSYRFRHYRQSTIDVYTWLWWHGEVSADSFNHYVFSGDKSKQNAS